MMVISPLRMALCQASDVSSPEIALELDVRAKAIEFVRAVALAGDGLVRRSDLQAFSYSGENIKLLDTGRGIRNPRQLQATLTIMTTPESRYDDTPGPEGLLRYAIRVGNLGEGDNRKLREAYILQLPLIWFYGIGHASFVPLMPVYLVAEEPVEKRYVVAIDSDQHLMAPHLLSGSPVEDAVATEIERRYVERMSRQRLHQPVFRAGVMLAYRRRCAVCSLARGSLLDAAHIVEDSAPRGTPEVRNGLALCKIHHAAYDQDILGISPDRVVHVSEEMLHITDGPMLHHGIQEFHGRPLLVIPQRRDQQPDPERLAYRFDRFRTAS